MVQEVTAPGPDADTDPPSSAASAERRLMDAYQSREALEPDLADLSTRQDYQSKKKKEKKASLGKVFSLA